MKVGKVKVEFTENPNRDWRMLGARECVLQLKVFTEHPHAQRRSRNHHGFGPGYQLSIPLGSLNRQERRIVRLASMMIDKAFSEFDWQQDEPRAAHGLAAGGQKLKEQDGSEAQQAEGRKHLQLLDERARETGAV